jgi:TonB-dependent receptor
MKKLLSLLGFLSVSLISFSQTSIKGSISDSLTNESLIGATAFIKEIKVGTATDINGFFEFKNIKPGNYEIEFRFISYEQKTIKISLKDTLRLDVRMKSAQKVLNTINIQGKVNRESNVELMKIQKNSAVVVDGVNAETFKKTPDNKASDVFKRISGTTVQDNKFVIIRGLNDRYNFGLINGSTLPSSESDRRAFSFDIFPSNMIDNILIMKTATPDLPGEFSGGVITINTSEPKDEKLTNIQLGTSYNTLTTFKYFTTSQGSKTDFLGIGSYERTIPTGIPTTQEFSTLTKIQKTDLAKLMPDKWSTYNVISSPNVNLQSTVNRNFNFKKNSSLGFIFAYNYQFNFNNNNLLRQDFEESSQGVVKKMELNDTVFTKTILHSGLLNITYNINDKNTIKLKNIYSINSEDKLNIRHGVRELDNDPHQWEKSTNFWYTENKLSTHQLLGEHKIQKLKIDWNLGYSNVKRDIPNLRRIVYRKYSLLENDTNQQYTAVVQTNGTMPTAAGNMFWSYSNEDIYCGRLDLSYRFNFRIFENEIKVGTWNQYRDRGFTSRNFGFSQYKPTGSQFYSQLLLLPSDSIFSGQNMGILSNNKGGFKLEESTRVDDSYDASSFLNAQYLMIDSKIGKKFRINGGLRVESYNQKFEWIEDGSFLDKKIDTTVIDLLPSVNLIYSFNEKFKLRTSYYKTVSRPEFRELAPFSFYNFVQDNIISGDPYLKRAVIHNADLRFEFYPSIGQIISISGFYKNFVNPIEMICRTGTSGAPELYFANVERVDNFGAELEVKIKLSSFSKNKEIKILNNTTIFTNLSYIKSIVDLTGYVGSGESRPLQGQSPYIINTGIFWQNSKNTWQTSLSYNLIGSRIYIVGNIQEPSVWEQGRNVLDFQITKKFKKWDIRLNVRDLLAQDLIYFQDLNNNRKFDSDDNLWQKVNFGQTVSLSAKYNF